MWYKSQLYKFDHEFIAEFMDREPSTKLSISRVIQKFETTSGVLNAPYRRLPSVLTWAFLNLVCYVDCCLINEGVILSF